MRIRCCATPIRRCITPKRAVRTDFCSSTPPDGSSDASEVTCERREKRRIPQLTLSCQASMGEALLLLATNFVYGAYHAIQPGHGKTIAAAYIVGARGRPVDAWILGIFVTLSHTSGIVLVGVLASLGLPGLGSHRIEAWLAVATGVLVILLGLWTLWTQRQLFQVAGRA